MHRHIAQPITQAARREHDRPLTQTIPLASTGIVPHQYVRIPVKSPAIFAKAQVLSSRKGHPIFVETPDGDTSHRKAFWVHSDTLPSLAYWLQLRVFPLHDLVDLDD